MNDAPVEAELANPSRAPQPASSQVWLWTQRVFWTLLLYVTVRMTYEQVLAPLYAPSPAITVGNDTTRVDGPVDAAGYVDYAAALDAPDAKTSLRRPRRQSAPPPEPLAEPRYEN